MQNASFRPVTRFGFAGAALLIFSAAGLAQGTQPTVLRTPSDAGTASVTQGSDGWIVSITASKDTGSSPLEFEVVGDDTTVIERIEVRRRITVTFSGCESTPDIAAGSPVKLLVGDGGTGLGVAKVMEIERNFSDEIVGCGNGLCPCPLELSVPTWYVDIDELRIDGDLGEDSQAFPAIYGVRRIVLGDIQGDVLAPIELDLTDASTSVIDLQVQGDVAASIESVEIQDLTIVGRLGLGETKESLVVVKALGGIETLSAGSISATIESGTATNPMPIGILETTFDSSSNADVSGTIFASAINDSITNSGIFVRGSLRGDLKLYEALESPIWIDGSLSSAGVIELPADGLQAQIIINRGAGSASWSGSVFVGSTELDSADYTEVPGDLAGVGADGSVGLAPYTIHHTASTPVDEGFVFVTSLDFFSLDCDPINPIRVRMYGPVTLASSGAHFDVLTKDGSGNYTVDAGFNAFAEVVSGTDSRTLKIIPDTVGGAWPFDDFAVRRLNNQVLARDVVGTPTVADDLHRFTTADGCGLMLLQEFDLNSDDSLCTQDLATWTSSPTDLNGDEVADGDDCVRLMQAIDMYSSLDD